MIRMMLCAFVGLAACSTSPPHDPLAMNGDDLSVADLSSMSDAQDGSATTPQDLTTVVAAIPVFSGPPTYFLARDVQAGLLYAYRIGVTSTGLHIASISTSNGALTPLIDDIASYPPLDVQVDTQHLYWLGTSGSTPGSLPLHRAALTGGSPTVLFDPVGSFGFSTTSQVQAFLVQSSTIYVLVGSNGPSVQLGTVASDSGSYTKIADVTYPGAVVISPELRGSMVQLAGKIYLALYAQFAADAGAAGVGFIAAVDTMTKTSTVFGSDSGHVGPLAADATRVYWVTSTGELKGVTAPSTTPGSAGGIPLRTEALTVQGGLLYAVSILSNHAYGLTRITPPPMQLDNTGVSTTLTTVASCQNADLSCLPYIPTIASDATSIYFTDSDSIYRYPL